ncbi:MAG: hypothetical protein OEM52_07860 [bacterium]|nr:hypothetical protein [bacterium]
MATLLVVGWMPLSWKIVANSFLLFGTILLFLAFHRKERLAVFPATLFMGTALIQLYFGGHSIVWFGDVILAYILLAGFAIILYYFVEPVTTKHLWIGMLLSLFAGVAWSLKRFVWPWKLLSHASWGIPLLFVILGLAYCWWNRRKPELWQEFRVHRNEESTTCHP